MAPRRVVTTALVLIVAVTALVTAEQPGQPQSASANPDVAAALQRGNTALTRRDFEAALDAFTKANQLQNKTSALALFGMARAFQGLDAFKSAADACVEGLKYVGTDTMLEAQLHNQRGVALLQLSQKPNDKAMLDAEAEFRTALTRTETLHDAWFNLGVALLKQNRDADGIAALQAYVDSGLKTPQVDDAKRMIENPRRAREVYAPEFAIASMEGEYIQLKDLRGKVVLLDFWATWCGPCVAATPMLTELAKVRAKDSRFILLSITDEAAGEAGKIRSFASQYKIAWPMIHDSSHRINAMYQVRSIPTYIVIDAEGIVRERVSGYGSSTRGTLDQAITKAIRAMDKK